jgi:hypothetical protein
MYPRLDAALWVVKGDEKGTQFLGHPVLWGYKYGDLTLQVRGASYVTGKYVLSYTGLGPESDCSGKTQKQLYSKLQTRPLVREGPSQQETRNCQTENKNLVMGSR